MTAETSREIPHKLAARLKFVLLLEELITF